MLNTRYVLLTCKMLRSHIVYLCLKRQGSLSFELGELPDSENSGIPGGDEVFRF